MPVRGALPSVGMPWAYNVPVWSLAVSGANSTAKLQLPLAARVTHGALASANPRGTTRLSAIGFAVRLLIVNCRGVLAAEVATGPKST